MRTDASKAPQARQGPGGKVAVGVAGRVVVVEVGMVMIIGMSCHSLMKVSEVVLPLGQLTTRITLYFMASWPNE
jgi:hypothetical protein